MRIMAPIFFVLALSLAGCGRGSTGNPTITPLPTLDPARMNAGNPKGKRISDAEWERLKRIEISSDKDLTESIQKAISKEELLKIKRGIEVNDQIMRQSIYSQNPQTDASRIKDLTEERARLNDLYAQVQRRLAEF